MLGFPYRQVLRKSYRRMPVKPPERWRASGGFLFWGLNAPGSSRRNYRTKATSSRPPPAHEKENRKQDATPSRKGREALN